MRKIVIKNCFVLPLFFFCFLNFPKIIFAQNYLQNPGFEESISEWTASSGLEMVINVTVSSFTKNNGQYSCEIKHNKTMSSGALQIIQGIIGGNKYQGKGYVFFNNEHNKGSRIRIAWYTSNDGSGSQIKTNDSNVIEGLLSSWQLMDTGVIEAPTEARSAEFRILLASSDQEEAFSYFDDLVFEEISLPTPPLTLPPLPSATLFPSQTPSPIPVSYSNIYINEFLADPESGNEKVEIKNNNDFAVYLTNWQIDDIENGGHSAHVFSIDISPSGLYTIDLGTNSFLNNDGDSVRLLDFNGVQKDKRDYSSSSRNMSWAKDRNSNWCEQGSSFNLLNSDCQTNTSMPTSTPVPTSTLIPSSTTKPTATGKPSPTPTIDDELLASVSAEEVLGTESAEEDNSLSLGEGETAAAVASNSKIKVNPWSLIIIAVGLGLIGFSIYSFVKQNRNKVTG